MNFHNFIIISFYTECFHNNPSNIREQSLSQFLCWLVHFISFEVKIPPLDVPARQLSMEDWSQNKRNNIHSQGHLSLSLTKTSQVHQSAATYTWRCNIQIRWIQWNFHSFFFLYLSISLLASPDLTLKPPVKTIIVITCNARIIFN